ncbi:hypothetical protein KKF84_01270 [Myxococcota bacterium]|nr:hypothetical protein [Myxococcota bacterium]
MNQKTFRRSLVCIVAVGLFSCCGKHSRSRDNRTPDGSGVAAGDSATAAGKVGEVSFSAWKKGGIYFVDATVTNPLQHKAFGVKLGTWVKKVFPEYEALLDGYVSLVTGSKRTYEAFLGRARGMSSRLPRHHLQEIRGFASVFGTGENKPGDGKLSLDEILFLNLLGDVARGTACSVLAATAAGARDRSPIAGRNLDWPNPLGILSKLHAVMTIRTRGSLVTLVGFLGHFGAITGMNAKGVFGAILDSGTGAPLVVKDRRSYFFDLRLALEQSKTARALASSMAAGTRRYTYNHLIFTMDKSDIMVLENVVSGSGHRAVRMPDSLLNRGVAWGVPNFLAVVNSFVLKGNPDNHSDSSHNTARWTKLLSFAKAHPAISAQDMRDAMAQKQGTRPGTGDVLNDQSLQTIIASPGKGTMELRVDPAHGEGGFMTVTVNPVP